MIEVIENTELNIHQLRINKLTINYNLTLKIKRTTNTHTITENITPNSS